MMTTKKIFPSLIVLAVVGLTYLYFSTIRAAFSDANLNSLSFSTAEKKTDKEADFKKLFWQAVELKSEKNLSAFEFENRHQNFDYAPQSIAFLNPFLIFAETTGYHLLVFVSFFGLWIAFVLLSKTLHSGSSLFYFFLFPIVTLISAPGLNAFTRGNPDVLATVFLAFAFLMALRKNSLALALLLSLAVVLKPIYLPLSILLFFIKPKNIAWVLFGTVQLVAMIATYAIGGTNGFLHFFMGPEGFLRHALLHDWTCAGVLVAFSVIGFFCFDWAEFKLTRGTGESLPRVFIFLLFCCVFWQCVASPLGMVPLIFVIPVMDRIFLQEGSASTKTMLAFSALFLALAFVPPESGFLGSALARNLNLIFAFSLLCVLFYKLRQPALHACVAESRLKDKQRLERWLCILES